MLVTYLRSSSYNNWDFCPMQYFITYVLGHRSDSGKKAELGTMVHKVMEVLAALKKNQQDNPRKKYLEIVDDAVGKVRVNKDRLLTDGFVEDMADLSLESYMRGSKHHWTKGDRNSVAALSWQALRHNKGQFDPRFRDIVDPEPHFDIPIEEDWAKYEYEDPKTGQKIIGQLAIKGTIDLVTKVDDGIIEVIDWKGLPLDTTLPTPNGWTTMGDVSIGDTLFDQFGRQCAVVGKSKIKTKDCFRITFDDTTSVVCDDEHLWKLSDGLTVSIKDLKVTDKINVTKPIDCKPIDLDIDPYVLGMWLGDGRNRGGEITSGDSWVFEAIKSRGYSDIGDDLEKRTETLQSRTVYGLTTKLRGLNLLNNKHIPAVYLRASFDQRLDLLRGLMDSDGNVNQHRKQCIFTTCDKTLSDDVKRLLITLGQRANQSNINRDTNFKKDVNVYPIAFRPLGINPFLLPRKAESVDKEWGSGRSSTRQVVRIDKAITQRTQCIAVDSEDNTYLCTDNMIPTHNTGQRKDWATGEVKTYEKLQTDAQLLLYNYAISKLYPDYEQAIMTIFFVKDGGPFSMCFDNTDQEKFLGMLKSRYEEIQATNNPKPLTPNRSGWKCSRLCHFYKNNWPGTDKRMCNHVEDTLNKKGMSETVKELTHEDHSISYYESPG